MTHSIAAMAERLRADPGSYGLTSGVGMHMTKHAYGLWSTEPGPLTPPDPRRHGRGAGGRPRGGADHRHRRRGHATVATYTVLHGRDGAPEWAALVCDLPDGTRCYARLEDAAALAEAEREELVGPHGAPAPAEAASTWPSCRGRAARRGQPAGAASASPASPAGAAGEAGEAARERASST